MSSKVIVRTFIFSGGDILRRAAESILSQTYKNLVWYILDMSGNEYNKNILNEYKDSRIIYIDLSKEYSSKTTLPTTYVDKIINMHSEDDYFVALDVDDYYKTDFLECMLNFMNENHLDVAACGSDFIDLDSGKELGRRLLNKNLILKESDDYDNYFVYIYQFLRTVWGKVFKLSCLKKCDFSETRQIYGNDTLFAMESFKNAERAGILSKSLHLYSVSSNSITYFYDPIRILSDKLILIAGIELILYKCGTMSAQNEEFLYEVYLNAISDTLGVILKSRISDYEKISAIYEMFDTMETKHLFSIENIGKYTARIKENGIQKEKTLTDILEYLFSLENIEDNQIETYCNLGEYICAALEYSEGWIFFKKTLLEWLINQGREIEALKSFFYLNEIIPNDEDLIEWGNRLNIK